MRCRCMEGPASGRNAMESNMTKYRTAGLALAGILAISAASVTDASAQWRGHRGHHGWGPGVAAGLAAGAFVGAAVASRPYYGGYGGGYYGGGYYYDEPVYAAPYAYDAGPIYTAPVYGSPGYGSWGYNSNRCQEGYRRVPCTQGGGF